MGLISISEGDDRRILFNVKDTAGAALNLEGFNLTFTAKLLQRNPPVISKSLGAGIATTGTTGQAIVSIDSADTLGRFGQKLSWKLRVIDADGKSVTSASGRMDVI